MKNPKQASVIQRDNFALESIWNLSPDLHIIERQSDPAASGSHSVFGNLQVKLQVKRRPAFFIYNVSIPMALFAWMSLVSFALPVDDGGSRLSVSLTLVLTTAAYKFVVAQSIPAVSYLTHLDYFVLANSAVVVMLVFQNAIIARFGDQRSDDACFFFFAAMILFIQLYFLRWGEKLRLMQSEFTFLD